MFGACSSTGPHLLFGGNSPRPPSNLSRMNCSRSLVNTGWYKYKQIYVTNKRLAGGVRSAFPRNRGCPVFRHMKYRFKTLIIFSIAL